LIVGAVVIWVLVTAPGPRPADPLPQGRAAMDPGFGGPAPVEKPPDGPPDRAVPSQEEPPTGPRVPKKAVGPLTAAGPAIKAPDQPQGSVDLVGTRIEDVAAGGNGRYVALSNGRQVFVFDVSAARVIHTINPVAAGGTRVRVAAGMH